MTAHATIHFSDGTISTLPLGEKLVVLDVPDSMRQSIAINQTSHGEFRLSYTKPLMKGKSWEKIVIEKQP